jgi:hypothetical protein
MYRHPLAHAAAWTAALAVLVTWPMVLDPVHTPVGHPGNDVWNHLWGYAWVASEIGHGRLPLVTDLMSWPDAQRLYFIDTFGAVASLPLQWAGGPVLAYNAVVFAAVWTAGLGAWALVRHVLLDLRGPQPGVEGAALAAAAAWMSAPHLIAQVHNGITETLYAGTLPWTTLAAMRLYARPTARNAVVAGIAGGLGLAANAYYGLFGTIAAGAVLLAWATTRRARIDWRRLPAALALAATVGLVVAAPVLATFASSLEGPDALVRRDPEFVWRSLVAHNMTDLASGFRPGRVYSPDLLALHGEHLLIVTYLGWTGLVGAVAGLATMRRWRDRLPWMAWFAGFWLLMLGPFLYVGGDYLLVAERRVPLPFLALFEAFPPFQRISHPFRFVMPATLGLAVLASFAVLRRPAWVQALLGALAVGEHLVLSPAPWPLARSEAHIPAYVQALVADPVPGGVLDLPVTVPNLERAVYLYWQTAHGRPSPYLLNEPLPPVLARSQLVGALLVAEGGYVDSLPPNLPTLDLVASGRALAALGARYVVMHESLYPPDRRALSLALLRHALGPETVATEDGRRIWRLETP